MKKIPTLFRRNPGGSVYNEVTPGCEWVLNGDGFATRKWDGTCCMVRNGLLFRRYDARKGKTPPLGFEPAQPAPDPITGHWPGWVQVGDGPSDRRFREAFAELQHKADGTYELCGPKIQGRGSPPNPEHLDVHALIAHGDEKLDAPRTFEQLREWLRGLDIEGIVWHGPDGLRAKIKKTDFGMPRR